jgi:hypothetical protein
MTLSWMTNVSPSTQGPSDQHPVNGSIGFTQLTQRLPTLRLAVPIDSLRLRTGLLTGGSRNCRSPGDERGELRASRYLIANLGCDGEAARRRAASPAAASSTRNPWLVCKSPQKTVLAVHNVSDGTHMGR